MLEKYIVYPSAGTDSDLNLARCGEGKDQKMAERRDRKKKKKKNWEKSKK